MTVAHSLYRLLWCLMWMLLSGSHWRQTQGRVRSRIPEGHYSRYVSDRRRTIAEREQIRWRDSKAKRFKIDCDQHQHNRLHTETHLLCVTLLYTTTLNSAEVQIIYTRVWLMQNTKMGFRSSVPAGNECTSLHVWPFEPLQWREAAAHVTHANISKNSDKLAVS